MPDIQFCNMIILDREAESALRSRIIGFDILHALASLSRKPAKIQRLIALN